MQNAKIAGLVVTLITLSCLSIPSTGNAAPTKCGSDIRLVCEDLTPVERELAFAYWNAFQALIWSGYKAHQNGDAIVSYEIVGRGSEPRKAARLTQSSEGLWILDRVQVDPPGYAAKFDQLFSRDSLRRDVMEGRRAADLERLGKGSSDPPPAVAGFLLLFPRLAQTAADQLTISRTSEKRCPDLQKQMKAISTFLPTQLSLAAQNQISVVIPEAGWRNLRLQVYAKGVGHVVLEYGGTTSDEVGYGKWVGDMDALAAKCAHVP